MLESTTTTDVNTTSGESSTPDVSQNVAPEPTNEQSLVEALKSENAPEQDQRQHEKYVPYDRFQEVIKAKQELESKMTAQEYQDYLLWDRAVKADPNMGAALKQAMIDYHQGTQTPQQQQLLQQQNMIPQDPNDPMYQVQSVIQAQQQQLQYLMQQQTQATYKQYESEFNNKLSALNVSDHWKGIYRNAVEQAVVSMNPNALASYDGNLIQKAIDHVHKQIETLQRSERASYVKDKSKDNLPPSTSGSGATPRVVNGDNSPDARRNEFLELLKAQQ